MLSQIVAGEEPKVVTSPDAPISPGKNLSPQQLSEAVRRQIEYYFSKENLQTDAYLVSQMDAVLSVPVSVVLKVFFFHTI